ncbi:hypothetical protein [Devosia sp. CN2-171]|uniref:hypothetical protein n=1 Tax=Devosia sp. CN2-171 TaxID=3400909 RepID=UPI003BF7DB85
MTRAPFAPTRETSLLNAEAIAISFLLPVGDRHIPGVLTPVVSIPIQNLDLALILS